MILKMATKKHKLLKNLPPNERKILILYFKRKVQTFRTARHFFLDPVSSSHNSFRHFGIASPFSCDVLIRIFMMKPPQADKPGDPHISEGNIKAYV